MRIMIRGAGVQGTLYGVLLARAGHDVTFIARGDRAAELRDRGAATEEVLSGRSDNLRLPVAEQLVPDMEADLCLVAVRREQIADVLPDLATAEDRLDYLHDQSCQRLGRDLRCIRALACSSSFSWGGWLYRGGGGSVHRGP
jgi:hypothetical protein